MLGRVLAGPQIVRIDPSGNGHFGSRRTDHTHQGTDLLVTLGELVFSPVDGRVVRFGFPYAGDPSYRLIELEGDGLLVKLMYVLPLVGLKPGDPVSNGQAVGYAQAVSLKYGAPMRDHIHVEVRRVVGAELVNPENVLELLDPLLLV